jgi:ABC-type branched-subunit amino acid transport system substrate-binding protein
MSDQTADDGDGVPVGRLDLPDEIHGWTLRQQKDHRVTYTGNYGNQCLVRRTSHADPNVGKVWRVTICNRNVTTTTDFAPAFRAARQAMRVQHPNGPRVGAPDDDDPSIGAPSLNGF